MTTEVKLTRLSVARAEIYSCLEIKDSHPDSIPSSHCVQFDLPKTLVIPDTQVRPYDSYKKWMGSRDNVQRRLAEKFPDCKRKYTWLYDLGVWVEENELAKIKNSHDPTLPGFDPENMIWRIFDALWPEEVVTLIAESFCNKCPSLGKSPEIRQINLKILEKRFYQSEFPQYHHNYIRRLANPDLPMACLLERHELIVDTYHI